MVVKVMSLWFSKLVLLKSSETVGMGLPPDRAQSNMRLIFIRFIAEGQTIESAFLRIHTMIGAGYGNNRFMEIIVPLHDNDTEKYVLVVTMK